MLQGVHRRGRHQIINDYHKIRKECGQESLGILELAARTNIKRDRDLEGFKGKMRDEATSQNQVQEKRRQVIWPGVIKKLNGRWNFSEEEIPKSR